MNICLYYSRHNILADAEGERLILCLPLVLGVNRCWVWRSKVKRRGGVCYRTRRLVSARENTRLQDPSETRRRRVRLANNYIKLLFTLKMFGPGCEIAPIPDYYPDQQNESQPLFMVILSRDKDKQTFTAIAI